MCIMVRMVSSHRDVSYGGHEDTLKLQKYIYIYINMHLFLDVFMYLFIIYLLVPMPSETCHTVDIKDASGVVIYLFVGSKAQCCLLYLMVWRDLLSSCHTVVMKMP